MDFIIKPLKEEGMNVKFLFKPMKGGKGEFYVWKIQEGENKIIFSNHKNLQPNAVAHGLNINTRNCNAILSELKAL
jgi:hypothetical protein